MRVSILHQVPVLSDIGPDRIIIYVIILLLTDLLNYKTMFKLCWISFGVHAGMNDMPHISIKPFVKSEKSICNSYLHECQT